MPDPINPDGTITQGGLNPDIINIGGAIVSGGINALQSVIDRKTQRESDERTIAANQALAEYSYSRDLDMWQRQNLYNTPLEQMRRIQAAGLNPNMIYRSGSVTGNTQGQIPKYSTPRADYHDKSIQIGGMLDNYQDFRQKQATHDNLKTQTNLVREKAITETIDQGIKGKELGLKGTQLRVAEKLEQYNAEAGDRGVQMHKANLANILESNLKLKAEVKQKLTQTEILKLEKRIKQKEMELQHLLLRC